MLEFLASQMHSMPSDVSIGWDKIILALIGIIAPMAAGMALALKKLLGPNQITGALLKELQDQSRKASEQHKALLEMQESHHQDRETRAREQHAEQNRNHESVLRAIADAHRETTAEFQRILAEFARRRDHDHEINGMLFRLITVVSYNKSRDLNCPEAFLALVDLVVKGNQASAMREFAQAHAPNHGGGN